MTANETYYHGKPRGGGAPHSYGSHSVLLDEEKCTGCTHCMRRCPTEAIRVRDGKARIIAERCIDCGQCIRVCPHHAKRARCDSLSGLNRFAYTVALPAPSLYGQFSGLTDINHILRGLLDMGFDSVFEVARGAELVSSATRRLLNDKNTHLPVISSACPAVTRLIRARFPALCGNLLPLRSPMQTAARLAKDEAAAKTGLPYDQIGTFFISPCPAKVTDAACPLGGSSWVDGAVSIADIYPALLERMNKIAAPAPIARGGAAGAAWAGSGGEAAALFRDRYLAADGIENVVSVLGELEDKRLRSLDFAELSACPGGCVGGVLSIENAYVAKARIQRLRKALPASSVPTDPANKSWLAWDSPLEYAGVLELSGNLGEAMAIMREIDSLSDGLPGLDCGSCGAPSCRALAEDVVTRGARQSDCVFILRRQASAAGIPVSQDLMVPE